MNKYVIIVAGGKGIRMGGDIPKQFLPILGKPVLMYTIQKFVQYNSSISILLVLPSNYIEYWKELCKTYNFQVQHTIVEGGSERYFSVKNALNQVPYNSLVAVHDGVRPFVSNSVIANAFATAEKYKTAIPVIPLNDSLRHLVDNKSEAVNRHEFKLVQTPQCFHSSLLKDAYNCDFSESYTDDASVVELNTNVDITLFEGNKENIKLTTSLDYIIARELIKTAE